MSVKPLHTMTIGEIACVVEFATDVHLKSRFMEMGVIPGARIRMIKKTPFKGPLEIKIRSFYISLRYEDANWILVSGDE